MRQIRGKWGGLSAKVISELIDMPYHTCRKKLQDEEKRLNRPLERKEIGTFISERIIQRDLNIFNNFKFNLL